MDNSYYYEKIPLATSPVYFTDANKTLKAGYTGPTRKVWQSSLASVQQAELEAIAILSQDVSTALNIIRFSICCTDNTNY